MYNTHIYIYIYVHVYIYKYIYVYIYLTVFRTVFIVGNYSNNMTFSRITVGFENTDIFFGYDKLLVSANRTK